MEVETQEVGEMGLVLPAPAAALAALPAQAAGSTPGNTAAAGASGRSRVKRRNVVDEDKEEKMLLRETARLTVQNARVLRPHAAALTHTALLPTSAPVVEALLAQGKKYYEAHASRRNASEVPTDLHGAPQHLWKVLVQTLLHSEIREEEKKQLRLHAQKCRDQPTLIEEEVHTCRVARAHVAGTTKICIGTSEVLREDLAAVVRALKAMGAEWKLGPAPRGPSEREIERLLTRLG
jgi:hypothetical protein